MKYKHSKVSVLIVVGVVAVFLLILVVAFQTALLPEDIARSFLPQDEYYVETPQGEMMRYHSKDCIADTQCMLVQWGYCEVFDAINEGYLSWWKREDKISTRYAQRYQQTCKLTTPEQHVMSNFIPACRDGQCAAVFIQQ